VVDFLEKCVSKTVSPEYDWLKFPPNGIPLKPGIHTEWSEFTNIVATIERIPDSNTTDFRGTATTVLNGKGTQKMLFVSKSSG
jgi:hypothetical protein